MKPVERNLRDGEKRTRPDERHVCGSKCGRRTEHDQPAHEPAATGDGAEGLIRKENGAGEQYRSDDLHQDVTKKESVVAEHNDQFGDKKSDENVGDRRDEVHHHVVQAAEVVSPYGTVLK